MAQIDKDRFHSMSMARCYDKMTDYLVPGYHLLQDEVIAMLLANGKISYLVDLGAGSGVFLEKVLKASPEARVVWVDYSEDFRQVALERLSPYSERVEFVVSPFTEDWHGGLGGRPDAICSMSAIHHLDGEAKRAVYARCFEVLRPGGWFLNIDEMSTMYEDAYRRSLDYWIAHVYKARQDIPQELERYAEVWCEKFDSWKKRNVENIGQPKQPGDDIHESFIEQMRWLGEIGYVNVDLFVKFHLWSVIGGQKP